MVARRSAPAPDGNHVVPDAWHLLGDMVQTNKRSKMPLEVYHGVPAGWSYEEVVPHVVPSEAGEERK
jgi:hypothetical protein